MSLIWAVGAIAAVPTCAVIAVSVARRQCVADAAVWNQDPHDYWSGIEWLWMVYLLPGFVGALCGAIWPLTLAFAVLVLAVRAGTRRWGHNARKARS